MIRLVVLALALAVSVAVPSSARSGAREQTEKVLTLYQEAMAAAGAEDFVAYGDKMLQVLEIVPDHPAVTRHVARALARQGRADEAMKWLSRSIATGTVVPLDTDEQLESLRGSAEFERLVAKAARNAQPSGKAEVAYRLEAGDFLPEGIAWDPVDEVFYLGSIRHRKIVRIDRDGSWSDFAAPEGMLGVLGLRIDPVRRELWAATANLAGMDGHDESGDGSSAIHRFDLDDGTLLTTYALPNTDTKHNLNDLVVTRAGQVYATDAVSGAIYTIPPGGKELEKLFDDGTTFAPNGLALSADDRLLYIAQYSIGVVVADLERGTLEMLGNGEGACPVGIDGLYFHDGSLVAVQNYLGMQRLARFALDDAGRRITSVRVLSSYDPHYEDPTTAAIVGDVAYVVANSQLPKLGADGSVPDASEFDDTFIVKVPLD